MFQLDEFDGRVALVTGGAGGIGRAVVEALRLHGVTTIAAGVNGTQAIDDCDLKRQPETLVRLDVTRKADIVALVERMQAQLGRVDILVNVAGVVSFGSAEQLAEAEWDRVLDINLKGTFLACQAVMATMKQQGFGRIINLGSVVGRNGGNARPWISPEEQARAANVAYGVSKAGVHVMTAFLAKELAAHGITVNAVAPGPIATAMTASFPEQLKALLPVGRMGTTEDVVRAVLFLASPKAGFITGEVLDVNGGMLCD